MELEKTLKLDNNINNSLNLKEEQNLFLNSFLGKAINKGVDLGIKAIFPEFLEDKIIDIKNTLFNFGLDKGIPKIINETIDAGKSLLGISTENFNNINEIKDTIEQGNLENNFSSLLDTTMNKIENNNEMDVSTINQVKNGKKEIISNVENNINESLISQSKDISNLNKFMTNWKNAYKNQDFESMEKQFKKINKEITNLVPLENILKEARIIENIHSLIKTNGHNFNISETEQELINKLSI